MVKVVLTAPVAGQSQAAQDTQIATAQAEIAVLEADIKAKGRNLGTFDPATPPGDLPAITAKDFFYNSADDNALYYAANDGDAVTAFTKLAVTVSTDVQRGSTADKTALGIVPSNTPFFDTDLGALQYYKTSSDNFTVVKAATDLPATVDWAGSNSVFSAMQFKITTSLTDTTDNAVINLPDGQDTLLYMIGRQFFNGSQAANTLGGAFTVRNDNGVLTLVSVEPVRHWGGGLDWTTAAYADIPNQVTAPININIAGVNSIFSNIVGAGVWTNTAGGASITIADDAEFATGTETTKPPQVKHVVDALALKEDTLPIGADKYLKRNAGDTAWEAVDLPITPQNLIAVVGAPLAADGNDGDYAIQTDAALGTNDIWGPKAAGAWPAQADAKSADPEATTLTQAVSTTGTDYTTPRIWATENLDQWGVSRRVQRIFNISGAFDFTGLGYADRTAVFIRNTDPVNGNPVTYGAGGAITREIVNANGLSQSVAGQDTFNLEPGEFVVMEKDGNVVHVSVLPAERVSYFDDYADAATFAADRVTYDGFALIRDTGEMFGRKTTVNSVAFPADGKPNADWFRVGDAQPDPQSLFLNYIEVGLRSAGTNASSRAEFVFVDNDGNNYPSGDWAYSADLTQYAGGFDTLVTDKALWLGGLTYGRNKEGTIKFYYTGINPNGLSDIIPTHTNGSAENGGVTVTYQGTNYNDAFANADAVTGPLYWTTQQAPVSTNDAASFWDTDTEYVDADNKAFVFTMPATVTAGDFKTIDDVTLEAGQPYQLIYDANRTAADSLAVIADDAATIAEVALMRFVGKIDPPEIALGYLRSVDYVVSTPAPIPNSGAGNDRFLYQGNTTSSIYQFDASGSNPTNVTDPGSTDWANGVRIDDLATGDTYQYARNTNRFELLQPLGELPIVRYTADGAIQDIDHRAIFETGAVNMTLSAATLDRAIQMVSEGPTTIITADGTEQFTGDLGVSTDSQLTLNDTFQWATIIGRGSGGWSQYVGQVGIPEGVNISTPTKFKAGTRLVQNGIEAGSSVTFPEAFKAGTIPTVIPVAQDAGDNVNVTLQTVTNTGFLTWVVRNESDVGIGSPIMHWIAIGEAA